MNETWEKLGLVFIPHNITDWMQSYASNPFALSTLNKRVRVFFSSRDARNRSSIGALELDLDSPSNPKLLTDKPLVTPGPLGSFDQDGTSMGSIVERENKLFLYYLGWKLHKENPWTNTIGLAISTDAGKTFNKVAQNPIVNTDETDPYSLSYPWVYVHGKQLKMLYGTNLTKGTKEKPAEHALRMATSIDGVHWDRNSKPAIAQGKDHAISRPTVIRFNNKWSMWYSFKNWSGQYKIGKATSMDGLIWKDCGEITFSGHQQEWDSEAQCYPCVFSAGDKTFMLYCGNKHGSTGFGLARLTLD